MSRTFFIIAYDIRDQRRLNRVRYFLKGYSTGGQKSVYECFLADGDLKFIVSTLKRLIFEAEDRIHIFQPDGRSRTHTMGKAIQPKNPNYFYIG